jgi:hypothetical protein
VAPATPSPAAPAPTEVLPKVEERPADPALAAQGPPTLYGAPTPPLGDAEPTQVLPPVPKEPPGS